MPGKTLLLHYNHNCSALFFKNNFAFQKLNNIWNYFITRNIHSKLLLHCVFYKNMWWDLNLDCLISTSWTFWNSVVVWMGSVQPKTLFFDRWYSFERVWKHKVCSFTGVSVSQKISFGDLEYCLIVIHFLCFPCLVGNLWDTFLLWSPVVIFFPGIMDSSYWKGGGWNSSLAEVDCEEQDQSPQTLPWAAVQARKSLWPQYIHSVQYGPGSSDTCFFIYFLHSCEF